MNTDKRDNKTMTLWNIPVGFTLSSFYSGTVLQVLAHAAYLHYC